ncbi:tyrosyl-DNA phosphodiesterase-domain-containing protein [Kalaharituber pfeilii]|nr:tyrosyl-DNA phosphodiesterase-domain-containing protein [Kalaharituber pfeilii]
MPEVGTEKWNDGKEGEAAFIKAIKASAPSRNTRFKKSNAEQEVISLDSDQEDDTKLPLKLESNSPSSKTPPNPQIPLLNALGPDRKKMEEERQKRKRERGQQQFSKDATAEPVRPIKAQKTSNFTRSVSTSQFYGSRSTTASSPASVEEPELVKMGPGKKAETWEKQNVRLGSEMLDEDESELQYPHGVVKKTYCEDFKRTGDDIKIEEVLQRDTLRTAVLSAFQWDLDWVFSKLNIRQMSLILVMQAKEEQEKEQRRKLFSSFPRVTLVFPDMQHPINCMHSKLMLLFHEKYLRVVVPSANLVKYDWGGMNGIMENTVFLIDLPRIPRSEPQVESSEFTFFAKELIYFCQKSGFPDNILEALHRVDYSKTSHLAFIHSIAGSNVKDNWKRTGYPGFATAVRELGLQSGKGLEVDFVSSSVGALTREFVTNMYRAVMGDNGLKELQSRGGAGKKTGQSKLTSLIGHASSSTKNNEKDPVILETPWEYIRDRFRIFFPSYDTVKNSRGKLNAGGTVCFQSKWWDASTFPKEVMRDCISTRTGLLMHNKLIFARPRKPLVTPNGKVDAFAYVGSANLSESAWGRLVMDRATKSPKLNVRNWECGVLIPVQAAVLTGFSGASTGRTLGGELEAQQEDEENEEVDQTAVSMDVFKGRVPVPMEWPSKKIRADKKPWFYLDA